MGHRCGSDLVLLCLWYRPATAGLIYPIDQERPYAGDVAIKRKKKKEQDKIFAKYRSDKGLISIVYKESTQLREKKNSVRLKMIMGSEKTFSQNRHKNGQVSE